MTAPVMRALEWALALQNAPEQRRELRIMPLPEGVEQVLEIAAGTDSGQLKQTAAAAGEPAARVQEAARFYAREILFHADADAYRTLGVAPDADAGQIKRHHRLLQRWLHPDRKQGDDAIFAARINRAWDALRTPERRRTYDASRPGAVLQTDGVAFHPIPVSGVPVSAPRWRRRLPVVLILLVCAVLAVIAVRDALRPAAEEPIPAREAAADGAELVALGAAVDTLTVRPGKTRTAASPHVALEPQANQTMPPETSQPSMPVDHLAYTFEPSDVERALPVAPLPRSDSPPMQRGRGNGEEAPPLVSAAANVAATAPRFATAPPLPASRQSALPPSVPHRDAVSPPAPVSTTETAPEVVPVGADSAQVLAAQRAGQALMRYMSRSWWRAHPAWNSPAVEQRAENLRRILDAGGSLALESPQWRIGATHASLTARVRRGPVTEGADGWVTAELVYRDGMWLVSGVEVSGSLR